MSDEEEIILVDKNDHILGYKPRSQRTDNDCWRIVSVWVENSRGQVLLQQRSFNKPLSPGMWTPAAEGNVPRDEDYASAAKRELAEEIGLTGVELVKKNKWYGKFEFGSRQVQGYTAACDWPIEKFVIQTEEVAALEWVDKQKVLDEITGKKPHTRPWPMTCIYWPQWFDF